MAADRPLYFWHVPKTAGTSLTEWLDGQFAPADIFGPQLLPGLRACSDAEVAGRSLYRGHLGSELLTRVHGPVETATVLREPRARTMSHLGHIWRESPHYLHERLRAAGTDLLTVLRDPLLRRAVADVQSRHLGTVPGRVRPHALPLTVGAQLAGQAGFELAPLPARPVLVARAVRRLATIDHVGVTERLDSFVQQVAAARGWPAPVTLPRSNVTSATDVVWRLDRLDAAELRALDAVNRADHVVYRVAASRWRNRTRELSGTGR